LWNMEVVERAIYEVVFRISESKEPVVPGS
jgi:hypothetical protein